MLRDVLQLGISVPDQLSIVGYDDLQVGQRSDPVLSAPHQPLTDLVEEAALMAGLFEGERHATCAWTWPSGW